MFRLNHNQPPMIIASNQPPMILLGQGGGEYEGLDQLADKLLPQPFSNLTKSNTRPGDEGESAQKRQKLHVERQRLIQIGKAKILKIPSKKGLAGFEYICRTCDKHFKSRLRCLNHTKDCGEASSAKVKKTRKQSQRKVHCNICDFEATTRHGLVVHRQKQHSELLRRHRCTRCSKQFASTKSFIRHIRRHASSLAFDCPTIGSGLPLTLWNRFETYFSALFHP